jgi:excisionase family DNA binding protein
MTADRQKLNVQESREKTGEWELPEQPKKTEYLTAKQLGQILQISESTIHKLRRAGKIPAVMLTDRLIRFNLRDVKHALRPAQANNHQHETAPQPEPNPQLSFEDFFKANE